MRRLILGVVVAALIAGGCSSGVDGLAIVASSQGSIGTGEQRVLIAVTNPDTDEWLASPEVAATATLRDRIGSPLGEYDGEFLWVVPEVRGLYAFYMDVPGPGTFQVTVEGEGFNQAGPVGFVAVDEPPVVVIGEEAPRSDTRTTADHAVEDITSDPSPDPKFYEMSVAEAVESGPTAIIFATPAWCTSQACGPLLDQVKDLSLEFPDLNYVHVEVYEDIHVTSRDDLELVPSVTEWGLLAEPWVFVTDGEGVVTASFEGAASDSELAAAFAAVAG